jgi:hypothetical protein
VDEIADGIGAVDAGGFGAAARAAAGMLDIAELDIQVVRDGAFLEDAGSGLIDVDLRDVVVRVPQQQFEALEVIGAAFSIDADQLAATSRLAAMGTAVDAQFGIDRPVVPAALAVLPASGLQAVVDAVGAFAPSLEVPADLLDPPPVRALSPDSAAAAVLTGLDPAVQYHRMLEWLVQLTSDRVRRRTPSHPVMAAPRLPDPVVDRLRRLDPGWVLGGVQLLPPNSISLFRSNPQFVEAVLAGANHEFARELVWRGYPTDSMGTCLPRFWPTPRRADGSLPDDVAPMATWGDRLGNNPAAEPDGVHGETTIVVVRGDLLRRYPETVVSAVFGRKVEGGEDVTFEPDPGVAPARELFRGPLPPDITYVGLDVDPDVLKTSAADGSEWFLALTQPVEGPRFGLDDESLGTPREITPTEINNLSWQRMIHAGLAPDGRLVLAERPGEAGDWPPDFVWGPASNAGHVAAALLQLPFQLLLPASENLR